MPKFLKLISPTRFSCDFYPKDYGKAKKKFKKLILGGGSEPMLFYYIALLYKKWLNGFFVHFDTLNHVRNPPKLHRLLRTCIGPVGAFECIKFGQLGGKLEVKRQNMATAI